LLEVTNFFLSFLWTSYYRFLARGNELLLVLLMNFLLSVFW